MRAPNTNPCGACDSFIPSGAFSRCETHHRATNARRVIADCPSFKPALRDADDGEATEIARAA